MLNLEYFQQKMDQAGFSSRSKMYWAVSDMLTALDQWELSEDEKSQAMNLLSGFGRNDLAMYPPYGDNVWDKFDYGNVRPGDYIKVKPDAYDSEHGSKHNGRVGVATHISGRRCRVRYLTETNPSYMHHPIENLLSVKYMIKLKTNRNLKE